MGNFDFLENAYPKIYEACDEMEHHFSTRKFKAALKAGREAAEYIVLEIFREEGKRTFYKKDGKEIYYSQNKLIKKLHFDFNVFKNNTYRIFDEIKALGNDASHPNPRTFTENDGRNMVRNVFKASTYFYFDYLDNPDRFKPKYKEVKAVKNISFEVEKGEIIAFIGPNGVITNDVPSGTIFSYVKEFYKEIKLPNWKPECEGEDYFYVSDVGIVLQETWKNNSDDGWRYTFGNCFKTYNEAAEARDKIKEILNNR